MTEARAWDIPASILTGRQSGWPTLLSRLNSLLETGKPLAIKMAPSEGFIEAVKEAVATKPWLRRPAG